MNKLLLITALLVTNFTFSQDFIVLSQKSANDKGITPVWPGCSSIKDSAVKCFDKKLKKHIVRTFRFPEDVKSEKIEGMVTVEFIINKKGKVKITHVEGGHKILQREAKRVIKLIPKMTPAKWDKKPIAVSYKAPIGFKGRGGQR